MAGNKQVGIGQPARRLWAHLCRATRSIHLSARRYSNVKQSSVGERNTGHERPDRRVPFYARFVIATRDADVDEARGSGDLVKDHWHCSGKASGIIIGLLGPTETKTGIEGHQYRI